MSHPRVASHFRPFLVVLALAVAATVGGGGCKETDKLQVTGLSPSKGDFNGGQQVVIKGTGFRTTTRNAQVYFGGRLANFVGFRGDDEMLVQAPGGKKGETVDVLVMFEPGGERPLPKAYTYVEESAPSVDDLDTSKVK